VNAYLDASVLLPTMILEPESAAVDRLLGSWSTALVVSDFAAAEVASALSRLVRTGLMTREGATERLADFDAWREGVASPCDVQPSDVRLAGTYVRRFELMLRAPDALHAAICRRLDLTLITLDRRLAAAGDALGLEVHVPGG